jgi:hypothetical protein
MIFRQQLQQLLPLAFKSLFLFRVPFEAFDVFGFDRRVVVKGQ